MRIENPSRWNEVDPAGHVAVGSNQARNERHGDILGELFVEIEGRLDLSVRGEVAGELFSRRG